MAESEHRPAQEVERAEQMAWLALAERSFAFWENEADSVWEQVQGEPLA